jgi:hypothetical protein
VTVLLYIGDVFCFIKGAIYYHSFTIALSVSKNNNVTNNATHVAGGKPIAAISFYCSLYSLSQVLNHWQSLCRLL